MLSEEDRETLRTSGSWPHVGTDLFVAVEAILARHVPKAERRGAEEALREAADEMDRFRAEVYGEGIFRRPTVEDYAAINALLHRERGHGTDRIGADCYDRAIRVQADLLRHRADRVGEGAGT